MKKLILGALLLLSMFSLNSCSTDLSQDEIKKIKKEFVEDQIQDSLIRVSKELEIKNNKINIVNTYKNIKSQKTLSFSGKRISIISNPRFKETVSMQYDDYGYYYYKTAKRNNIFIYLTATFYSSKTYDESPNGFLPKLNIYVLKSDSTMLEIGGMDCNFLKDENFNGFIESYFNYHEKATFVYYLEVPKEYINSEFFICINNDFDKTIYKK